MRERRVPVDGATLAAAVSSAGPTMLVALHGASVGVRSYALYQRLHATLPAAGIGVVTFDRRGEGESTGERSVGDFARQAADARSVLEAVGAERAVAWGYSQGAWVAPLVAAAVPEVRALVCVAAPGVSPADQMRYGVAEHLRREGVGADVVGLVVALRDEFRLAMRGESSDEAALGARLAAASAAPWWPLAYLPAELPDAQGRAAWRAEMEYDPVPAIRGLGVPALLVYGHDDEWTPVAASIAAWRAARGDEVEAVVLDGVGHDLHRSDGSVDARYERAMLRWLVATLEP